MPNNETSAMSLCQVSPHPANDPVRHPDATIGTLMVDEMRHRWWNRSRIDAALDGLDNMATRETGDACRDRLPPLSWFAVNP